MGHSLRIGVIGAGWYASRRHLPDIQSHPELKLAALCRRDPAALEILRNHFHAEQTYTDWHEMLDRCALDAVLIATPHSLHYEQARAALERGLHVLVEKPMALRASEARELRDLAQKKKLMLSVALNPPFWRYCHRLREHIQAGRIGDLEAIDLYWTGNAGHVYGEAPLPADLPGVVPPTMYRGDSELCGGGWLHDMGPHLVSEIHWVTGLRATEVACIVDTLPSDRRALLFLALENGATATLTCVGNSRWSARRLHKTFGGSAGTILVESTDFKVSMQTAENTSEVFHEKDLSPVPSPVANFVDSIHKREALLSPPDHGVYVTEVIEAAYRSAASGEKVSLSK